ncbi:hypothetical protein [Shewanella sp. cp20]|uniref:hypothetical protein n=1 Tax=Shewanella sp. cp20 TaxID=1521167 RepID=UPI000AA6E500|nr:hypothetical protein [Shewanella sp. cp20]
MPTKKRKSNQYHYFGNILRAGVWLLVGMTTQVGAAGYDIWLYFIHLMAITLLATILVTLALSRLLSARPALAPAPEPILD